MPVQSHQLLTGEEPEPQEKRRRRITQVLGQSNGCFQICFLDHIRGVDPPLQPPIQPQRNHALSRSLCRAKSVPRPCWSPCAACSSKWLVALELPVIENPMPNAAQTTNEPPQPTTTARSRAALKELTAQQDLNETGNRIFFCWSPTHHIKAIHEFSKDSSFLSSSQAHVARLDVYGAPQRLWTGTRRGANRPDFGLRGPGMISHRTVRAALCGDGNRAVNSASTLVKGERDGHSRPTEPTHISLDRSQVPGTQSSDNLRDRRGIAGVNSRRPAFGSW